VGLLPPFEPLAAIRRHLTLGFFLVSSDTHCGELLVSLGDAILPFPVFFPCRFRACLHCCQRSLLLPSVFKTFVRLRSNPFSIFCTSQLAFLFSPNSLEATSWTFAHQAFWRLSPATYCCSLLGVRRSGGSGTVPPSPSPLPSALFWFHARVVPNFQSLSLQPFMSPSTSPAPNQFVIVNWTLTHHARDPRFFF